MLSVAQSAEILGVSAARVRALVSSGVLPAQKVGRNWILREEDVYQRVSEHPRAGRPAAEAGSMAEAVAGDEKLYRQKEAAARKIYLDCKEKLAMHPSAELLNAAKSAEEASFYVAVSDFFLQQKQRELIAEGVF